MNILSSILAKQINNNQQLTIVWTQTDNQYFLNFIKKLNHNLVSYNDLYFGDISPNLIICNNKLINYELILSLSIKLHLPVLVIDHNSRSNHIDESYSDVLGPIPCSYHVAISQDVYNSWGKYHDQIINYNINDSDNLTVWNNLLYQISNKVFNI